VSECQRKRLDQTLNAMGARNAGSHPRLPFGFQVIQKNATIQSVRGSFGESRFTRLRASVH
jgi:hypothetical protein